MNNQPLGQKIKTYRTQKGLSQLALENLISASPGSISRIESGKVNPTKETIIDISKELELDTYDIARLFEVDLINPVPLFELTTELLQMHNKEEIINRTVNELILKMGYLASAIFLVDKDSDKVYSRAITNSNIAESTFSLIPIPFNKLNVSLSKDTENLTVKTINEDITHTTKLTRDYVSPAVNSAIADLIQKRTGNKSHILYPLKTNSKPFGAIVYIKKIDSDFNRERDLLKAISAQISLAIYNAN